MAPALCILLTVGTGFFQNIILFYHLNGTANIAHEMMFHQGAPSLEDPDVTCVSHGIFSMR